MRKLVITALIAVNAGACGSNVRGTTEQVSFISEPAGASMTTNMKYSCPATPCTLEVERSDEFNATFSKPGYRSATIPVRTKVVTKGAAGFAGNLLAGGVVGMGVDAYTGAAMDHDPNPVVARLSPAAAPHPRRTGPAANAPGM